MPSTFTNWTKTSAYSSSGPTACILPNISLTLRTARELCGDIPSTGRTVIVLDFIEGELRSLPVEVRVIKDTGSEQDLQAITVLHVPAKVYQGGSSISK